MATLDGLDVRIVVERTKCLVCGQCVKACPCEYLATEDGKMVESKTPAMNCLTCGHCAAVCPEGALSVESERFPREDVFEFPEVEPASFDGLYRLLAGRRSIRQYEERPVAPEVVGKILEAAQTAPAGLPPSAVKVCVLEGKEQVRSFAFDFLDETARMGWLFSKAGIWVLRPFMTGKQHKDMREKIAPLYRSLIEGRREGKDFLFYDAPLAMVFMSSAADPVDPTIAATYAMIAAESLGLGSCMIGTVAPMLPRTRQGFRDKYRIPSDARQGLALVLGYSKVTFRRAVRRRFAEVIRPRAVR